jgi:DNA repair exonuclease SbcCD nuclease subunit
MTSVRFVHAADLHLDAPFKGVDASDPRVRAALVASTFKALDAVVSTCLAYDADFLVLAGDVYNSAELSLGTEFAFRDALQRLSDASVRVYIARGNHDPARSRTAGLELPEGVYVFSEHEVERVTFERNGEVLCALYGRSFRTAAETANLALEYVRQSDDPLAIGVLHTNVGGRPGHEPYAPCSLDDLRAARMDYWALGHIHKPEVLASDPPVIYAGCTQGLTPNEQGVRGCTVVTLGPGGAATEFVPTSAVVWTSARVEASDIETLDGLRSALGSALDETAAGADGRPAIVRIEVAGRSPVHADLARPGVMRDLLADVRAEGLEREPWLWVDRLTDATRPALDLEAVRSGQDFSGDLVRLADDLLADDRAVLAYVDSIAGPVLGLLDRRDMPSVDPTAVLERARDLALDRLMAGEDE